MAKKGGNPDNLKTLTPEQARIYGAQGGKKSQAVQKERRLMSKIYAAALADGLKIEGEDLELSDVIARILARCDAASVSLMKEIREATEGSKVSLSGADGEDLFKAFADMADAKVRKEADLDKPEL